MRIIHKLEFNRTWTEKNVFSVFTHGIFKVTSFINVLFFTTVLGGIKKNTDGKISSFQK